MLTLERIDTQFPQKDIILQYLIWLEQNIYLENPWISLYEYFRSYNHGSLTVNVLETSVPANVDQHLPSITSADGVFVGSSNITSTPSMLEGFELSTSANYSGNFESIHAPVPNQIIFNSSMPNIGGKNRDENLYNLTDKRLVIS